MLLHWMLYSSLVSLLLALAAAGAENFFGRLLLPRRAAWVAAMTGSVLIPLVAIGSRKASLMPEPTPAVGLPTITIDPLVATLSGNEGGNLMELALSLSWAAASAVLFVLLLLSLRALHRERAGWKSARVRGRSVWIATKLGPAVFGVRRPSIVLPHWVLSRSESAQELILAHEEEHIRARDLPLLLAGTLLVILLPWNLPLIWQVRRLRQAVELDCDRRVLAGGFDPVRYGRLLLDVDGATAGRMMVAALVESPTLLERRIRTMLSLRGRLGIGAFASMAAAVIAVVMISRVQSPQELAGASLPTAEAAALEVSAAPPSPAEVQTAPLPDGAGEMAAAGRGGEPRTVSELDSPPRVLNVAELMAVMIDTYPRVLLDAGISGRVTAELVINADGTVDPSSIRIMEASHDRFIDPSIRVVESFLFAPGIYQGAAVPVRLRIPIAWQANS